MNKRTLCAVLLLMLAAMAILLSACDPADVTQPTLTDPSTEPSLNSSATSGSSDPTEPTWSQTDPTQPTPSTQPTIVQTDPTATYSTVPVPTVSVPEGHDHSYGDWSYAQALSCIHDEIIVRVCEKCGQTEQLISNTATGVHTYDEAGKCTGCDRRISLGLQYRLESGGGSYVVMGIGSCADEHIVIPEQHLGLPVTAIGSMAFASLGTTPSQIHAITIPASVTTIGNLAFAGCHQLTQILVDGEGSFRSAEGVLYDQTGTTLICYPDGLEAAEFTVPKGVTTIGAYAFAYNTRLQHLLLGDEVTHVMSGAFLQSGIQGITIGPKVQSVEPGVFSGCDALQTITVHESNLQYASDGGVLFTKDMASLLCYPAGSKAQSYLIPDGVTFIAPAAFLGCVALEAVSIPNSVVEIAEEAFYECEKLTTVLMGEQVGIIGPYAFGWCTALQTVTLSPQLNTVAEGAFYGCSGLASIVLPDTLAHIDTYVFDGCEALSQIHYSGSVAQWLAVEKEAYWDGVTGDYAFYCADMTDYSHGMEYVLTEEDGVAAYTLVSMGSCRDTDVVIPALYKGIPVTRIDQEVFNGRSTVTTIHIPDTVVSIASTAFAHCYQLQTVILGRGVQDIGSAAFLNCTALTEIAVSQDNEAFASRDGVLFTKDGTILIAYPGGKADNDYVLPEGVTTLGDFAFYNCDALVTLTCPAGMLTVGQEAFSDCDSLVSVALPQSLTTIGSEAFYECDSLAQLQFGGTIDGWYAVQKGLMWSTATGSYVIECADGTIRASGWTIIGTIGGDNWTVDLPMIEQVDGTWLSAQAYALELGDTFQCRLDGSTEIVYPQEYFVVETPGVYYIHLDPVSGVIQLLREAE